ncbi:MAG: hypothetical protein D6696_15590 [Acidobacteria bacterium]|nr:MAG: hypothetical protein D6696_15590 [Acidobacteriota bacterium]
MAGEPRLMADLHTRFHQEWLGLVQPSEGLLVSLPVLVEAQCMARQPPETQQRLLALCPPLEGDAGKRAIADLDAFLAGLLELEVDLFDRGDELPEDLALWVAEGRQLLRPTLALRHRRPPAGDEGGAEEETPASRVGRAYVMLVWDLPAGLDPDKPEMRTGDWHYPPQAKFERLLRHCRVPIGLLTNRRLLRLIYAPRGESTGWIDFRIDDMAAVGGRPILDALVMLLSAYRFFGAPRDRQLPALLERSRRHQAEVTNDLAEQVFQALEILLQGFETAAERDGRALLDEVARRDDDHLYGGLLSVLLRLVFVLYAEDRGLLPVEHPLYAESFSLLALFDRLQEDHGRFPDTMGQRFGAWGRLLALFRAIYFGARHDDLQLPARRGELFDPDRFPFLEGRRPGTVTPLPGDADRTAAVRVPAIDDGTVYRVLEKLIVFQGQRLSYATLDVEQIGSVYEALMGYHVARLFSPAVCVRGEKSRAWLEVGALLEQPRSQRPAWLRRELGLSKSLAGRIAKAAAEAERAARRGESSAAGDEAGRGDQTPAGRSTADAAAAHGDETPRDPGSSPGDEEVEAAVIAALEAFAIRDLGRARPGRLVIQPGAERRRTSSHYTPRSLSAPIVERTLEPLLRALGEEPTAAQLLALKICDPAMGSGAFLVEACRFLADRVVAAWEREGRLPELAAEHPDVVNHARRLVAQRCLYGVDKNAFAVGLAKLSLWLVTLAKDLPFTFLDHALRHGDSLVGLDFDQIRGFHWQPERQRDLCSRAFDEALDEAIALRQEILDLAGETSLGRRKERLLADAEDALARVKLIADLALGAFFAADRPKARQQELGRRLQLLGDWLASDQPPPAELRELERRLHQRLRPFHWVLEFPEIFHPGRADPLSPRQPAAPAGLDAVVGNPPFAGKNAINAFGGRGYLDWLKILHPGAHGNADYSAHFFRRAAVLIGEHGTIGLIATNTIAQGDTRASGLKPLVEGGLRIYHAIRSLPWPGDAAVAVAVVHLAKGTRVARNLAPRLDGEPVAVINSRLRPRPERPDPRRLEANRGLSFQGSIVVGMGFVLTPEERDALIAKDRRNGERIFPYLGGEEVNTSPTQSHHRYVISFGAMSLEEAERWPDLIEIVRRKVKPERDRNNRLVYKKNWWQYAEKRPALYRAIASLDRCLVASIHSKHLLLSLQPTNRIFSHGIVVFCLQTYSAFAVLQSRVHEYWARLLSSSLGDTLRYAATDCFETFPFPHPDPRRVIDELEEVGERLYDARAAYMEAAGHGLTETYNRLKDPSHDEPSIRHLRRLHLELDRAVLRAYGWPDVDVPPYVAPQDPAAAKARQAFEDDVVDRLFLLNHQRAEAERRTAKKPRPSRHRKRDPRQLRLDAD